jgi:hypothetical protein
MKCITKAAWFMHLENSPLFKLGIIASLVPEVGLNYESLPEVQKVYEESL